ncbi:hypothetical protein ABZO31_28510 [Streptomyces sp. HUAS MG47]|uniref:hypothetical protein n=1 Tax=Streptomyces solicamelliae TaxID=3231716 RepID=UPI003878148C
MHTRPPTRPTMRVPRRDVAAVAAAVLAPFLAALAPLPLRTRVTLTDLALLMGVAVWAPAPEDPPGGV